MKGTIRNTLWCCMMFCSITSCKAQNNEVAISHLEVQQLITKLSHDDMRGRNSMIPKDITKASELIEAEFQKAGLKYFKDLGSYKQIFHKNLYGKNFLMNNVVGVLPGKTRPEEMVIFSAHYDHIGIMAPVSRDSIANGADDDASGVAAVIELAKYFATQNNNERTLVFVAFTAEEVGGYGSIYFSEQINPDSVVAMFNIEMIGKPSKFGNNSAFITGFDYSDFGKILQQNLEGTAFKFYPDPYPRQNLFYRSDNAQLAKLGIPAHTISSSQIDKDKLYHTVNDEIESIHIENLTAIIQAIALSAKSIVSGEDTPSRIQKSSK